MGRVETRVGVVEIERLRAAARFRVAQQVGARQRAAHTAGRRIVAVSGARAANEPATRARRSATGIGGLGLPSALGLPNEADSFEGLRNLPADSFEGLRSFPELPNLPDPPSLPGCPSLPEESLPGEGAEGASVRRPKFC
eukprot:CAMPEP_0181233500 /NCGR_PEP_ID=MMETSP1096-20121128/36370_1 /TAXON_ID=156174 ORGANISM="Chrysochromulina ericina, Strain CCMP281" /NCGR_SAMPLE_ID=MMETSP1096 /ASSEMBLY_ACC=CAM_ASM_000453 /LENGTH=139 /DNA_ID=CAMNT_0023328007 /DNA_START=248 /DNA_END=665 /DNA_ORIENTATION=+